MVSTKDVSSEWLGADDVTDGDKAVILDEAQIGDTEWGKQLQCTLEFKGQKKKFGWNKTNTAIMEDFVGTETKDWVGKTILLYAVPVLLHGKTVKGVRVGIPPQKAPPTPVTINSQPNPELPKKPEEETPADKCKRGEHTPTTLAGGIKVCAWCGAKL